ncbi:MAG: hypothetical protein HY097_04395 [Nitrospinae bacterium]|nr:hypothetical protein [Nitrospinota bacterium]MBI3815782.1 hypothetical protein [Nitrospinota bacterium]
MPALDIFIKLANASEVEMWEMFDFGHEVSRKELKETMSRFLKELDEDKLRMTVKLLRAVVR